MLRPKRSAASEDRVEARTAKCRAEALQSALFCAFVTLDVLRVGIEEDAKCSKMSAGTCRALRMSRSHWDVTISRGGLDLIDSTRHKTLRSVFTWAMMERRKCRQRYIYIYI